MAMKEDVMPETFDFEIYFFGLICIHTVWHKSKQVEGDRINA